MAIVVKTIADILPLSEEAVRRLERLKNIKDEDIDISDMPELTSEQLSRMETTLPWLDERKSALKA
jgi:hypothetical protein